MTRAIKEKCSRIRGKKAEESEDKSVGDVYTPIVRESYAQATPKADVSQPARLREKSNWTGCRPYAGLVFVSVQGWTWLQSVLDQAEKRSQLRSNYPERDNETFLSSETVHVNRRPSSPLNALTSTNAARRHRSNRYRVSRKKFYQSLFSFLLSIGKHIIAPFVKKTESSIFLPRALRRAFRKCKEIVQLLDKIFLTLYNQFLSSVFERFFSERANICLEEISRDWIILKRNGNLRI